MNIWEVLRSRRSAVGMLANGLLCLLITIAAIVHFNSTPSPSHHALVGSVVVNLDQLGYRLRYEDLQKAGLFGPRACGACDFSRGSGDHFHRDYSDARFMSTLYRAGEELWLNFYGNDVSSGKGHLQQSLHALRAAFPGSADAIREVIRGAGAEEQLRIDLLVGARTSRRVESELVRILEEEGFRITWRRMDYTGVGERMSRLGALQHSQLAFVKGELRYWPGRPEFEASMVAMRRDMPSAASGDAARQVLSRLRERLATEYGKGRVRVRTNFQVAER